MENETDFYDLVICASLIDKYFMHKRYWLYTDVPKVFLNYFVNCANIHGSKGVGYKFIGK